MPFVLNSLIFNSVAILLYMAGTVYLLSNLNKQRNGRPLTLRLFVFSALLFQAIGSYHMLLLPDGINLGVFKVGSLIFWIINLIVVLSGLKKPLNNLFLFLFPLSALSIISATASGQSSQVMPLSSGLIGHVLLSIFAYSLLIIATLQALLLAYQDHQIKHKHPTGIVRLLPPLQTMESLFFDILWAGEFLLTLSIFTGFIFLDNMFAQHLVHKTFLSLLAWVIYATLLIGHWRFGWRGYLAIRWALGGFCVLMLAYFGSKFVMEVLLQ